MSAGRQSNSPKKDWNTPPKYINAILEFWPSIDLDPCSNEYSLVPAKVEFKLPENGLNKDWSYERIYVNPPYGRNSEDKTSLFDWFAKGIESNKKYNCELIYLIPVATNTKHFKDLIFKEFSCICFLNDTRLRFYNQGNEDSKGAPMACCLCFLGNEIEKFNNVFKKYGKVFNINGL
jgi:hypothetical protein